MSAPRILKRYRILIMLIIALILAALWATQTVVRAPVRVHVSFILPQGEESTVRWSPIGIVFNETTSRFTRLEGVTSWHDSSGNYELTEAWAMVQENMPIPGIPLSTLGGPKEGPYPKSALADLRGFRPRPPDVSILLKLTGTGEWNHHPDSTRSGPYRLGLAYRVLGIRREVILEWGDISRIKPDPI